MASLLVQFDTSTMLEKTASTLDSLTIESDGSGDAAMSFLLTGGKQYTVGIDNSDGDKFKISDGAALGMNDWLVIHSGNFGIGVTPVVPLHVAGSEIRIDNTGEGHDGYLRFINDSGSMSIGMSGASENHLLIYDRSNSQTAYTYKGGASGSHDWRVNNASQATLNGTGLGIGTSPDEKLDVDGNVIADAYKLQDGGQANFTIWTSGGDTKTVSSTTTETTLLPTGDGSKTLASAHILAGREVRLQARGLWELASGTMIIKWKIGTTTIFGKTLSSGPGASEYWEIDAVLSFSSTSDGTGIGKISYHDGTSIVILGPGSTLGVSGLSGDQTFDCTAKPSVSSASNYMSLQTASISVVGAQT